MDVLQHESLLKCKVLLCCLKDHESPKRVETLRKLGNLLSEDPQARDYFNKEEGKNVIVNRLMIEKRREFVEAAFYCLSCSTTNHIRNQNALANEEIFDLLNTILKRPNIVKFQQFCHCTLHLMSTIIYQNSVGQHFIRESGCLNLLLLLFHKILSRTWKDPCQELEILEMICQVLYLSVNNPRNEENQNQVALIIPKTLVYLSFLIFDSKIWNDCIVSCLRVFTGALSENKSNQKIFIEYGGMIFLNRLLFDVSNILEEESLEVCIMLMDLLISSNNLSSSELPPSRIVTFLLDILQKGKCKVSTLFLLFHLMENDVRMQEVFIRNDGAMKINEICLKEVENEELELISTAIWTIILKNNKELLHANIEETASQNLKDPPGDGINSQRKRLKKEPHGIQSPNMTETSSVLTFDMTSHFNNRLPKAYKNMHKNTERQPIQQGVTLKYSPVKNIQVGSKRKLDTSIKDLRLDQEISDDYKEHISIVGSVHSQKVQTVLRKKCYMTERNIDKTPNGHQLQINQSPCIQKPSNLIYNQTPNSQFGNIKLGRSLIGYSSERNQSQSFQKPSSSSNNLSSNITCGKVKIELSKTPTGFQINLHTDNSKSGFKCVTRSNVHTCNSSSFQLKEYNGNSDIDSTSQEKMVTISEDHNDDCNNISESFNQKYKAIESSSFQLKEYNGNSDVDCTSQMKIITISDDDKDDCHNMSESFNKKNKGIEAIPQESEESQTDSQTQRELEELIPNSINKGDKCKKDLSEMTQANENVTKNGRSIDNGVFCPINSLETQEIDTELGNWDVSKHGVLHNNFCNLEDNDENSQNGKCKYTEETVDSEPISVVLVKKNKLNDKKELMIPSGQKKNWRAEKGSLDQIPLTRQEIKNLSFGIKKFGLNFIAIRKNCTFLSTRTSKDLFVAWRAGLIPEYPVNEKMLNLSSDDSYSSDD